jgi:hypothetical protein
MNKPSNISGFRSPQKFLRKIKMDIQMRTFVWLISRRTIQTDEHLTRGWWKGKIIAIFVMQLTVDHLFFYCPVAKLIWRIIQSVVGLTSLLVEVTNLFDHSAIFFNKHNKKRKPLGDGQIRPYKFIGHGQNFGLWLGSCPFFGMTMPSLATLVHLFCQCWPNMASKVQPIILASQIYW